MNQNKAPRMQIPVIILAILSLIFIFSAQCIYLLNSSIDIIRSLSGHYYSAWGLLIEALSLCSDFILLILNIVPAILLLIYVGIFFKKGKATILVPIVFALLAIIPLYYLVENLVFNLLYNPPGMVLGWFIEDCIFQIPIAIAFILAGISTLKGWSNKVLLIIAVVVGLLTGFSSLYSFFEAFRWLNVFQLCAWPISILGEFFLYAALLMFGLTNQIPSILRKPATETPVETVVTE